MSDHSTQKFLTLQAVGGGAVIFVKDKPID